MKKICINLFLFYSFLFSFFNMNCSMGRLDRGYLETAEEASRRDALSSKFAPLFAPEDKVNLGQNKYAFSDSDYPGLKECQRVWRDSDCQDEMARSIVKSLLHDEEDFSFTPIQSAVKTSQMSETDDLSLSPVSELSWSRVSGVTTLDAKHGDDELTEECLKLFNHK